MINFKITSLESGFLSIEKPSGKAIALKLGEIVKADIMDILPSGDVVLKLKGEIITAKTEVPLNSDSTAYFKVTGQPQEGKELRLQFVGLADTDEQGGPQADLKGGALQKLVQEFQALKTAGQPPRAETIESLIKALPPDINSLPKEMKIQIQDLLTASLKSTGQSIQTRLDTLFDQLPETIKNQPLVENLKKELLISVEKLLGPSLKTALQNTGVILETKLRSALADLIFREIGRQVGQEADSAGILQSESFPEGALNVNPGSPAGENPLPAAPGPETPPRGEEAAVDTNKPGPAKPEPVKTGHPPQEQKSVQAGGTHPETPSLKGDLKASLLELKQLIAGQGEETSIKVPAQGASGAQGTHESVPLQVLQGTVDNLLRDIETFQALSKTTDSFYTFLPLSWKELRDGEISFKRGPGNSAGKPSYSCRINLDLEEFGNLAITVLMYNRDFFVSFRADRPDFKSSLESNLDALRDAFRERGLSLKAAHALDKDDVTFEPLEKLEPSKGIINIEA